MKVAITHPGQVHLDDLMCMAVFFETAGENATILRRDPTPEELENPEVMVLDVGGQHEPSKGNFDHHQLSREAEPNCAFAMMVKAQFPELDFENLDWFQALKVLDSKGPFAWTKANEFSRFPFELSSPVEAALKEMIRPLKVIEGTSPIAGILRKVGEFVISQAKEITKYLESYSRCPVITIGGKTVIVVESKDIKHLGVFRDAMVKNGVEIHISICLDDRGPGWTLYRYADSPGVNFSVLQDREDIVFAHNGGFIAKTTEMTLEEAKELVALACH